MKNNFTNQDYIQQICYKIARILNERNISMRAFSYQIGKSNDYIQKLIIGEIKELKLSVLLDICRELSIHPDDLLCPTNNLPTQYYTLQTIIIDFTPEQYEALIHIATLLKKNGI